MGNKQLRIILLYEFKLGHITVEASRKINSAFSEGDETLEDHEDCGRKTAIDLIIID